MKKKKVYLISGSTGGHALPIFDIWSEIKDKYQTKIFVSGSSIENEIFGEAPTIKIISGRLHRHSLVKKITGIMFMGIGFVQSFFYLLFNRPKLIMSKGGFLSVPILSAAKALGIPYFSHESDSEMGLANKKYGLYAKKLFVGFPPEMYDDVINKKAIYSGQIIRKKFLSFDNKKQSNRIFITGGSQGARKINNQIFEILDELLNKHEVHHQLGEKDCLLAEKAKEKLSEEKKKNYHIFGFSLEEVERSFESADLVIGRAGANTIGEIAALKKASILIPYPYAAADHQSKNAKYLEKSGSAIIIKEDVLSAKILLDRINYLFSDNKNLQVLGEKISKAIKHDGLEVLVSAINDFMKG